MRTPRGSLAVFRAIWPLALAIGMLGCGREKKPVEPTYGSETPSPVVRLRSAILERNLDEYASLLADSFVFVFAGSGGLPPRPDTWGRADELTAAGHLFGSDQVERIVLSFRYDEAVASEGDPPGTWRVDMTDVTLDVEGRRPDGGRFVQKVTSGREALYLREFPLASGNAKVWKIVRWEDKGADPVDPHAFTWGGIKAMWR